MEHDGERERQRQRAPEATGAPRPRERVRRRSLAVFGLMAARGGGKEIDPSRLATSRRATWPAPWWPPARSSRSTKVEIKSKASGIVKRLFVDYGDTREGRPGAGRARPRAARGRVREARANLLAAEAAWERNKIEAEGPDLPFLKSALERARKLYADGLIAPSLLEDADKALPDGPQQADGGARARPRSARPRSRRPAPPSSATRRTCATRRSRARWTASCCRATWRWATRSARSWCSARRRRW